MEIRTVAAEKLMAEFGDRVQLLDDFRGEVNFESDSRSFVLFRREEVK